MCEDCGCSDLYENEKNNIQSDKLKIDLNHYHNGNHHHHDKPHKRSTGNLLLLENNLLAERNRGFFEAKNVFTLNLMSSPGSGKTCLIDRTIVGLKDKVDFYVIEGNPQTIGDTAKIMAMGAEGVQLSTGNSSHLNSEMIHTAVKGLNIKSNSLLFIENVGNLVCPSLFDLGETIRVVIISVAEGEEIPLKYPTMFQSADVCIFNKIDLLPHLEYDLDKAKKYALQVNHHLKFFELSAKSGDNMNEWYRRIVIKKNKKNSKGLIIGKS